jgi:Kef-type K+ transport system membrane component KefB
LYAIFFVIAGADLNIGLLATLGVLGVIYVVARSSAKLVGPWLGSRGCDIPARVRNGLGFAMLSQAGLAIGLTITIGARFPDLAPVVNTIVLSAVVIFELIGPFSARLVLVRSGEVHDPPPLVDRAF